MWVILVHFKCLGNKNERKTLYLDTIGGNSSLIDFGANKKVSIEVML